jgi:hypothetical protein
MFLRTTIKTAFSQVKEINWLILFYYRKFFVLQQKTTECQFSNGVIFITSDGHVDTHKPQPVQMSSFICAVGTWEDVCGPNIDIGFFCILISIAFWGHADLQEPQPLHRSSFTSGNTRSSSKSRSISPKAPSISRDSHLSARGCLIKPT